MHALVVAMVMAGAPLFNGGQAPLERVLLPKEIESLSASACANCHAEIAAQWRRSRHARSWANPIFIASYARETRPWCVHCHAPLPEQHAQIAGKAASLDLASEGINCVVCHVRDGTILSAQAPSAAALAAHPIRHEPALGEAEFCAACHQFNFPIGRTEPVRASLHPMQNTFAEWKQSAAGRADQRCQNCHMAEGNHRMAGGHDVALLQRTIRAVVSLSTTREVQVKLSAFGAGHRVPTGDPFRRLRIELCEDSGCEHVVDSRELGRTVSPAGESWMISHDATVPSPDEGLAASTEISFRLPESARPHFWRLIYLYAAASTESGLSEADRRVELSSGMTASLASPF